MILPVILSGGVGSRLWPLSRQAHPKPFIKLSDGESLLQKTYKRAIEVCASSEVLTVTNRDLFFYTRDQYEETGIPNINQHFILEPSGRNSTAAIAAAAHYALERFGKDCTLLVMPADHLIDKLSAFSLAVEQAEQLAATGKLVTFGIQPTAPETGYGYILAEGNTVQRFVEKPNIETAQGYLDDGNYYWNSGMFCMTADLFLKELNEYAPDITEQSGKAITQAKRARADNCQQIEMLSNDFGTIESISVDYALFEKSSKVGIIPCDIAWSDIGSWKELGGLNPIDDNNNQLLGNTLCLDTHDSIIHGNERLVATLGVKDLVVVDTLDALLIADKGRTQDVRDIVDILKSREDKRYKDFPKVHRPWGSYTVLQEASGFKLKRIEVKPKARLSLQSHKHRSEHWVVVSGTALITNGEDISTLTAGQSTYIPLGNKHRLENPGSQPLIIVEVQCGDYLGEDDIQRYEDNYGRSPA